MIIRLSLTEVEGLVLSQVVHGNIVVLRSGDTEVGDVEACEAMAVILEGIAKYLPAPIENLEGK
jgi:hypothetical protein